MAGNGSTQNENSRFWGCLRAAVGLVGFLWVVELVLLASPGIGPMGVLPGTLKGLVPGVLLAPVLHGGPGHLFANSVPLILLLTALMFVYPLVSTRVLVALYLVPGLGVWLFGRHHAWHIGASGVVYGLVAFLMVSGIIRRDLRSMAVAMLSYFLYGGSLLSGVLPVQEGISWETHLGGALAGTFLAIRYRQVGRVPPKRYDWEEEDDEHDERFEDRSL